jgi:AcrR family transcriptional regulator
MTAAVLTTRDRILDAALDLASRHGSEGTSMRELAEACGVNVAALYYHFPSKAELLRAVIEERHYVAMMADLEVPPAGSGTDRERLRQLMLTIWDGVTDEEPVWRLLLAESCHRNPDAEEVARSLVRNFEDVAAVWLTEEFDELAVSIPIAARLLADFLFANLARVAIGAVTDESIALGATDLAEVISG